MRGQAITRTGASWLGAAVLLGLVGVPSPDVVANETTNGEPAWAECSHASWLDDAPMARDLRRFLERSACSDCPVKLIVQTWVPVSTVVGDLAQRLPLQVDRVLEGIDAFAARVPAGYVPALLQDPRVKWISPDRKVSATSFVPSSAMKSTTTNEPNDPNHLAITTGASQVIASVARPSGINGSGIGVAILDSGIFRTSCAFRKLTEPSQSRVLYWEDFTDDTLGPRDEIMGGDLHGHGSHAASMAVGNGCQSDYLEVWAGLARNADIMALRVLNRDGMGDSSDVIAAIDRVIKHRAEYNIRVINLSLGTTPGESYRTDPLCVAVERAVDAGLVVVVAAGNYGTNDQGEMVYGGILSPAIDPKVITVGATDTRGTNLLSDDAMATFSSRGPTLGCYGDTEDTCDMLLKPDIVAPGTYLEGVVYPDSHLYTYYPQTHIEGTRKYYYLHGTSVAAPIVTGTVALMLQQNHSLTPNLVKAILQYTAIPFVDIGVLDQGAGRINVAGAVEMAAALRGDITNLEEGDAMLPSGGTLPVPYTEIAGQDWSWNQMFFWEWRAISGDAPFRTMQGPWKDAEAYALGGGVIYPEMEVTMDMEGEDFVWAGAYAWERSSFVWGGSFTYGGLVMDYDYYASWAYQLDEDPISEEDPDERRSFVWGGSVVSVDTLNTPNTALVDGQNMSWGYPL